MYRFEQNGTKRNRFTRMCIGEAFISLLQEKEYDKIQVGDIAQKAGVSRMTYYKYYEDKDDVIVDFIYEVMNKYYYEWGRKKETVGYEEENIQEKINFSIAFFKKFDILVKTLARHNMNNHILDIINQYITDKFKTESYEQVRIRRFIAAGVYNVLCYEVM